MTVAESRRSPPWRSPLALLRRYPLTASVYVIVVSLGTWTVGRPDRHATLMRAFGISWADLAGMRLHRLATAVMIQSRPGLRSTIGLLLVVIPFAEWRLGPRRTAITLFIGDWVSTVSVLITLRLFAAMGSSAALTAAMTRDGGTSSGVHALAAATIVGIEQPKVRRYFAFVLAVEIVTMLVFMHRLYDAQHALAALTGWGLARIFRNRNRNRRQAR